MKFQSSMSLFFLVTAVSVEILFANDFDTHRVHAKSLLDKMTLDEKISFLHGHPSENSQNYVGYVTGNSRLGIPSLRLADAGNGFRDDNNVNQNPV